MKNGLIMKYFVLSPTKYDEYGKASRKAMAAYATAIFNTNEDMAVELMNWINSIETDQKILESKPKQRRGKK